MFRTNFGYTVAILEAMIADLQSKGASPTFDAICGRYFADFKYLARGAGIPTDWEEDCVCEGLMHLHGALMRGGFQFNQANSDIRNWFTRVFKNFSITYKRKLDRAATDELPQNLFLTLTESTDSEWKEHLLTQFNIAFATLCADCKALLTAHYWEGIPFRSIAVELHIEQGVVNQRATRCRRKLANALRELL